MAAPADAPLISLAERDPALGIRLRDVTLHAWVTRPDGTEMGDISYWDVPAGGGEPYRVRCTVYQDQLIEKPGEDYSHVPRRTVVPTARRGQVWQGYHRPRVG